MCINNRASAGKNRAFKNLCFAQLQIVLWRFKHLVYAGMDAESVQEPVELLLTDGDGGRPGPGPGEVVVLFQSLVKEEPAIAFPDESLDAVIPFAAEEIEHVLVIGCMAKVEFDLCGKASDPAAKVRIAGGDVDLLKELCTVLKHL